MRGTKARQNRIWRAAGGLVAVLLVGALTAGFALPEGAALAQMGGGSGRATNAAPPSVTPALNFFSTPGPGRATATNGAAGTAGTVKAEKPLQGDSATALVMDVSQSMDEAWQSGRGGISKLNGAKEAALRLLNLAERERRSEETLHLFSLVRFSSTSTVEAELTDNLGQVRNQVERLETEGNTDLGAGLELGLQQIERAGPNTRKLVIVLTDGKVNRGRTALQILDELGGRARQEQICIYTIGIGDPNSLDETFLKQLAAASCGDYFYASDAAQLENVYIRLRHQATGQEVKSFEGVIQQNQTVPDAGRYEVKAGQGQLYLTLNWKGSKLDLDLRDPKGQKVTDNYPGAKIDESSHPIYVLVRNPLAGTWTVGIYGRDVPEGTLKYNLTLSTRTGSGTSNASVVNEFPWWAAGLGGLGVILIMAGIGLGWILRKKAPDAPAAARGNGPYLIIQTGRQAGHRLPLKRAHLALGRAELPGQLVLDDAKLSRVHARLHFANGSYYLEDAASANGTYLNGMRLGRNLQPLADGDAIQLGNTKLMYVNSRQPRIAIQAYLKIAGGTTFPLYVGSNSLGRDARCRVKLNNPDISAHHATITIQSQGQTRQVALLDHNSRNGTFINGNRLTPETPTTLNHGDEVRLGELTLQFLLAGVEEPLKAKARNEHA